MGKTGRPSQDCQGSCKYLLGVLWSIGSRTKPKGKSHVCDPQGSSRAIQLTKLNPLSCFCVSTFETSSRAGLQAFWSTNSEIKSSSCLIVTLPASREHQEDKASSELWKCFEEQSAHANKVLIISDNFFELNFIDTCDIHNPGANKRGNCSFALRKLGCLAKLERVCMYPQDNPFNMAGTILCTEDTELGWRWVGRKMSAAEN